MAELSLTQHDINIHQEKFRRSIQKLEQKKATVDMHISELQENLSSFEAKLEHKPNFICLKSELDVIQKMKLKGDLPVEIFNNTTKVVKDDLVKTIKRGDRISIAAACFSIYVYQELKKQLESCEELRFIFTSPTFVAEKTPKERREFYIPRLQREKSLYGTEFEVRLRNELKQKAVAKECADWMRRKVCFKTNTTREGMNNFLLVDGDEDTYTYMPMNTFTTVDLGCERGNNLTNMITRMENPASKEFLHMFDSVWNDEEKLTDVTGEVIDMISSVYQENSPELIYFMSLYNIFSEFLEDISEDVLPNEATGANNLNEMPDLSSEADEFDYDDQNTDFFNVGKKVKIDLRDMDYISWKREMDEDIDNLQLLILMIEDITPEYDFKLNELIRIIREKVVAPINPGNKKILIFTAFSDTAEYLYENISGMVLKELGLHTALVTGSVDGKTTIPKFKPDMNHVLACFSPKSKDRDVLYPKDKTDIDILIATDCISEGQNLQDCDYCVNYDIHWNPVRIIQRFGRIDRIGSRNAVIQLVNFWPDLDLDEYINLKSRVETRMRISVMTSTGDDDLINQEEKGDLEYRHSQLKKLQEEVVDLEDMTNGISIMDLGLNEFRMDLLSYMKTHKDIDHTPFGIHAVVKGDKPGVIFVLKNVNEHINIENQNRLHPFYKMFVAKLQYTVTTGQQQDDMNSDALKNGASFIAEKSKTYTLARAEGSAVKYDLVGKIAEGAKLTRRSATKILAGIRPYTFAMFKNNPEEFITKAIRLINEQKATMIVEQITYNQTDGTYDSSIFTAEKNTDFSKAYHAKKNVQDYVFADGYAKDGQSIERQFAESMDLADEVCVYAKLPKGFSIPTPVGNYSPDWAIAFNKGTVKHIFFIAETKGTMDSLNLKPIEQSKIACAKKLFSNLSSADVVYHEVNSYQHLSGCYHYHQHSNKNL